VRVNLGVSLLLIADCRCTIPGIGVRLPVHDTRP